MIDQKTATIHLVQSSRFSRRFANFLLVAMLASILGMAFLPWQQTSRGSGQVVAYAPQERQQSVQSKVKGFISKVEDGIVEGTKVKKGDPILEIKPFASNKLGQFRTQLKELKIKEETALAKIEAYANNVVGFSEAGEYAVNAAKELVAAARADLSSKQKLISGYVAKELQARLNHDRQKSLAETGIKANKEVEKLKKEWDVAISDLASIKEEVESKKLEVKAKLAELEEKRILAQTKVDYARALEEGEKGNLATVRKEIQDIQIKIDELQNNMIVPAPRDGTIFRIPVYELGQAVKEGDSLFTIIPDTSQNAVELFVNGVDMPLVQIGQEVRLQFEGWPAVQFAGWPSVAVGTFSGRVAAVDATDDGKGKFRILVIPNEDEQKWPSDRYLRQGVRANGWVMMRQVSLGYEIWRQLNGFPIILADDEPKTKQPKPPKLPK